MEHETPTIDIHQTVFIVDVSKTELRERDHPANTISFHDLQDKGTHYQALYDKRTKNLAGTLDPDQSENVSIIIPRMTALDPVGMSLQYNVPLQGIGSKSDFEVMVNRELLDQRRNGVLPTIDIAGDTFIVDWRMKELRSEEDVTARIDLRTIGITSDGKSYECFYNTDTRRVVEVNGNTTAVPASVVLIQIPNELRLDPVAVSREFFNNDTELLKKFPIQQDLKATVIPLAETSLNEYMANNKKRIEQQDERQPSRKRHRPKL